MLRRRLSPIFSLLPLLVLLPLAGLPGAGCGGVTSSQVMARDQATTASCDWYQMCGQIGPDATTQKYQSRSSCDTQVRGSWESAWPPAQCDGKINQAQLQICLDAIHATQCTNLIDIVITLGAKCAQASICNGP